MRMRGNLSMPSARATTAALLASALAAAVLAGCAGTTASAPTALASAKSTYHLSPAEIEDNLQEAKARRMLGEGAQQMQGMQKHAAKLDVAKLKESGIEMQATAVEVLAEAEQVKDPEVRALLVKAAEGLRKTGQGAEQSSPKQSYAGVNQVLGAITELNKLDAERKASGKG